ncbi:MAG: hypothetical protein K2Y25_09205 [Pseudomonadaceae bacterium]|nr:hypothetical protein [Pseudomonadaceae bacterium]
MARARNIKPALFKNEVLGVADPMLTLLFEGLWLLSDRSGRLEDRPLRIKGELFPYRDGLNMESMLEWLALNGFIVRYQVDGKRYIEIDNFVKHQNPHKNEPESEIPSPSDTCAASDKIGTTTDGVSSAPADSLIPDSLSLDFLIPDSLTPEEDQNHSLGVGEEMPVSGEPPAEPDEPAEGVEPVDPKAPVEMTLAWMPDANLLKTYCVHYGVSTDLFTKDAVAPFTAHHETGGSLNTQAKWVSLLVKWVKGDKDKASNVRQFPQRETQSRHTGFADRDYTAGLTQREDGTYAF